MEGLQVGCVLKTGRKGKGQGTPLLPCFLADHSRDKKHFEGSHKKGEFDKMEV
jgi:hypothetical protein